LLLHRVQLPRLFGLSAAGASFFCFSRRVGKAAQGRGPDSSVWNQVAQSGVDSRGRSICYTADFLPIAAAQALRGIRVLTVYKEISKDICVDQHHR